MQLVRGTEESDTITPYLSSTQREILSEDEIDEELSSGFNQMLLCLDQLIARGSGWTVDSVISLNVHFSKYQVLKGGTTFEKLPKQLQAKKAIINVVNDDDRCFVWSILASKFPPVTHPERLSNYERHANTLNLSGLSFPLKLKDISRFERRNELSVNVFGYEDNTVIPYRISKLNYDHLSNLMLYKGHYSWIKKLDRLLSDQRKSHGKKYFCPRCLLPQYKQDVFNVHVRLCRNNEPTRAKMPTDNTLKFRNYHRSQRAPYIIYADFESLLIPTSSSPPSTDGSYTIKTHEHIPCGFGFVELFQCCEMDPTIGVPIIYRGENCATQFLEKLVQLADVHAAKIDTPVGINMSPKDWQSHNLANHCSICSEQLSPFNRVRDHCHFCSRYRGAAHSECNLAYRNIRSIPVVFHNLKRYDSHILMKALGPICNNKSLEVSCIAKTMEEYVSFSIIRRQTGSSGGKRLLWKLCFIDSLQFLPSCLESLVSNLRFSGDDAFKAINDNFALNQRQLVLRKGIYPYEFMNSWERFKDCSLPKKEEFYSSLSGEDITDNDYVHAQIVWDAFSIKDLGEYHDLYVKTDVLLLCDIFENFRSFCLEHYKLDPAHYLTLPSFGFDACLRMTNVQLQLLTDSNMYALFENGIRGGISVVSHRFSKANNPYIPGFDNTLPTSYILYMDMNNLYGSAMVEKLPLNNCRWLTQLQIQAIDWKTIDVNGDTGYVLEVDLKYPATLHNKHSDYPLAPERLPVTDSMLSPYCENIRDTTGASFGATEKLIPNLRDKSNYILHFQNLQLYLRLGLKLQCVHRVIAFNQSNWMLPYIKLNTSKRQLATSEFDKDLFKLLNNAVFGKTMENVRQHLDVKLVTNAAKFKTLAANPRYKFSSIFTEELVGVSMHKTTVKLCKPIFVGFTILEISKVMMFKFHYNTMLARYGGKAKLCLTDTDSFIYSVETNDIYRDIEDMLDSFDTSNYSQNHRLFSNTNKKVLGKMKDEMAGQPPSEFVGLRSKMYSLECAGQTKMRAKVVQRAVLKQKYKHALYRNILLQPQRRRDKMTAIRSINHSLYSVEYSKVSLSPFDDKRYILNDGVSTLLYFHVDIMDCAN